MPSKKALLSRLFLSRLLRVCCSGQLHVDLMIIFCNHADQTDTGAAFWLPGRISPRTCCLVVEESSFAVMHMHEKNGACVVQDTSTGHLNLSCAVLSLDSSVFIFWNRYCTYTAHGFHARLFAVIHALEESVVASFAPQLLAACLLLRAVHVHLVIIPR